MRVKQSHAARQRFTQYHPLRPTDKERAVASPIGWSPIERVHVRSIVREQTAVGRKGKALSRKFLSSELTPGKMKKDHRCQCAKDENSQNREAICRPAK